jgi:hypothetical protein
MNAQQICTMEKSIISAHATERWNELLESHLKSCTFCQDSIEIAKWMGQLAAIPEETRPPDFEVIWTMSRITQASRRRFVPQWEGIAAILAAACIAVWAWSPVESVITKMVPQHSMLLVLFLVSLTLAAGMTLFALSETLDLRRR